MTTCAKCGRDIVRRYVGSVEAWGHTTNPGPNHHDAAPASKQPAESAPASPTRRSTGSFGAGAGSVGVE